MTRVVATGVFSLIHPGHVLFLNEASKLGDELIVIVARDKTVGLNKGRGYIPEKQRLDVISRLDMVDKAVLGDENDIYKPIIEIKPDIIALGRDQKFDEIKLKAALKQRNIDAKVIRIKKYLEGELYSSRQIIEHIRKNRDKK
ncbi:MAG: FAD synthase [Candidatus Altiarchaeales archaeon ex4484_96]|nr:MAG: FAD synthase [Candidatus Altiarchaeales archaeon ex4484_96]